MTSKKLIYKKSSNLGLFLISKEYKSVLKFLAEKKLFAKICQGSYLQAHRTLSLYAQYLGKILKFVRGKASPYFPNADYSQNFLKHRMHILLDFSMKCYNLRNDEPQDLQIFPTRLRFANQER